MRPPGARPQRERAERVADAGSRTVYSLFFAMCAAAMRILCCCRHLTRSSGEASSREMWLPSRSWVSAATLAVVAMI